MDTLVYCKDPVIPLKSPNYHVMDPLVLTHRSCTDNRIQPLCIYEGTQISSFQRVAMLVCSSIASFESSSTFKPTRFPRVKTLVCHI